MDTVFIVLFYLFRILSYMHKWRSLKERNIGYQTACYFVVEDVALICSHCLQFEINFL